MKRLTHINLDQSQTEFKYWTHQSEAGCSCDQSRLVVSSLLSQEALAPRVHKSMVYHQTGRTCTYLKYEHFVPCALLSAGWWRRETTKPRTEQIWTKIEFSFIPKCIHPSYIGIVRASKCVDTEWLNTT